MKPLKGTPINYNKFPANKLIGCWDFLEGTGNITRDAISRNNGTITGAAAPSTASSGWNPGKFGRNLVYDATNDYVNIANTVNTIQTISFWARPSSTTQRFLQLGTLISVYLQSGTVMAYGLDSSIIYVDGVQTTTMPNDSQWHNITVVGASSVTGNDINIGLEALNGGVNLDMDALYYAQAANNTIFSVTTEDISLSAVCKFDSGSTGYQTMLGKFGASGAAYYFRLNITTGKAGFYISDAVDAYTIEGNTDVRDNKWHHLAAIIDRDNAANCKVFLDGTEDGTTSKTGTLGDVDSIANSAIFEVGSKNNGQASYKLDGQIRDIKIYIAAGAIWSDAQVLYQATHPFDYTASSGTMTDYWQCNDGSGTTVTGNVNNLTLTNAAAWSTEGQYYSGQLDLIRLYSIPLTQQTIRQLYYDPFMIYRG